MSGERFLVRAEGGPNGGTRVAEGWTWPLPELLLAEGGSYIKRSESDLPPQDADSHVVRGAQYEWQAGDPTPEQLTSAISVAIKAKRLDEVPGLLAMLALQDPAAAGLIYDTVTLTAPRSSR